MEVPHKDPDDHPVLDVRYEKDHGLTLAGFHPPLQDATQRTRKTSGPDTFWQVVADRITDLRNRFAAHNALLDNPRCSAVDRRAVLAVYNEALGKLEHISALDAHKINLEVVAKVSVILDLCIAKPEDAVFYCKDSLLAPLEPQYAQPRLDYYARGVMDDSFYWTGFTRLREWRKEGWPHVYPERAVEKERMDMERIWRKGMTSGQFNCQVFWMAYGSKAVDWGEEVDADPERPWKC